MKTTTSVQRRPPSDRHSRSTSKHGAPFAPQSVPTQPLGGLSNQTLLGLLDSGVLQAKLRVGPVNDPLEREADRVAEQVTRPNALAPGPIAAAHPDVQRKCAAEEDRLQRKPLLSSGSSVLQRQPEEKEDEPLQAQAASPQGVHAGPGLDAGLNRLRGRGSPLPAAARSYFEPRFGRDFTPVRVHTGPQAASLARSIDAQAFTVNRDMVFGAGRYQPETPAGRRLLAHELTHVVQQSRGGGRSPAMSLLQRKTTRGAGGCGPRTEIDEDNTGARNAGSKAHIQIQSFLFPKAIRPELEIPRATKSGGKDSDTNCQPKTRHEGFADLWKHITDVQIGEIKPVGSSNKYGVPQAEHYMRRGRQSVDRLVGTGACRHQTAEVDDIDFSSRLGMIGPAFSRVRFRKLAGVFPTSTVIGPFDGDRSRTLKAELTSPGAIGYWCTGGASETLPCDASGKEIEDYIDSIFSAAEGVLDQFFDKRILEPLDKAFEDFDTEELLKLGNTHAGPAVRKAVADSLGLPESVIPTLDEATIKAIAKLIDSKLKGPSREMIRIILARLKNMIVGELKRLLKKSLRSLLRQAIAAICVGAPVVTLVRLLDELKKLLEQKAKELAPVAAVAVAARIAVHIAKAIANAIAEALKKVGGFLAKGLAVLGMILVAIAVAVVFVLAFLAIFNPAPGDEALLAALGTFLARLLPPMWRFAFGGLRLAPI